MNTWYRVIGGAVIAMAVAGVIWSRSPGGPRVAEGPGTEVCAECALPPAMAGKGEPTPPVPTGSGLPCLAEFGSDECESCQKMTTLLARLEPRLEGAVDIVRVDTDDYPAAGQEWKLRMIPTQVAVSADGKELWRHEGVISEDALLVELGRVGITLGGASGETGPES